MMKPEMFIAFCSPAGSTRHVANVIQEALVALEAPVTMLDIGGEGDKSLFVGRLRSAAESACLFIGSPVYRDHAVPPVMAFIESMPEVSGCRAVPFVTWGGATSGIALWQMGRALSNKGFLLSGAAKVLAQHSMMWRSSQPSGAGHPDAEDDRAVGVLVRNICSALQNDRLESIALERLDYHPKKFSAGMKKRLNQPWLVIPKEIDTERCTRCEVCMEVCPVQAITLSPYPAFGNRCFDCFNCIRLCPEEAILPAVSFEEIEKMIKVRVRTFDEKPKTQTFLAP